jgi:hypothetical protein
MFSTYKRKESEEIQAAKAEADFKLDGKNYTAGDYIVQNKDGSLEGVKATEFEEVFEIKRKTRGPKKGSKKEAEQASEKAA